jgi:hypothetical protein
MYLPGYAGLTLPEYLSHPGLAEVTLPEYLSLKGYASVTFPKYLSLLGCPRFCSFVLINRDACIDFLNTWIVSLLCWLMDLDYNVFYKLIDYCIIIRCIIRVLAEHLLLTVIHCYCFSLSPLNILIEVKAAIVLIKINRKFWE